MADETTKQEAKLTRYLIYETDEIGVLLKFVGDQDATSSDQAYRLFSARLPADREGHWIAVSENACKIRERKIEKSVKATVREIGPPGTKFPDPEPEPEPQQQLNDGHSTGSHGAPLSVVPPVEEETLGDAEPGPAAAV